MKYQVITPSGLVDQPIDQSLSTYPTVKATAEELGYEVISIILASILYSKPTVIVTDESFDSVQERRAGCYR